MSIVQDIYKHSPVWLQNAGVSAYGYVWKRRRFGGIFQNEVENFITRESFDSDMWRTYQLNGLRRLLVHAYETVPYYAVAFDAAGVAKSELIRADLEALSRLPLLEKESMRGNEKEFISTRSSAKKLHVYATSGTTGTPVSIMFSDMMHQRWSAAYEARCRRWAGVDNTMSRAMIGGRLVVPEANAAPPFWRYNAVEKQLYMSAFHISPENVRYYVEELNRFKPDYLVGYASAHFFLARMIEEARLPVHSPRAVLTSSEKLTDEMREVLERVYRCRVHDAYSGVEACCLASECEQHTMHVSPDVGIIELVDESGNPVRDGEAGEMVATGLLNFDQPLIRYRTGDWAILSNESCQCGRSLPVLKELVGRLEDTVVGRDGRETVRFHGIFVGLPHVREGQVIQDDYTKFRVKLVVEEGFSHAEEEVIRARFTDRLGEIELQIEFVDRIERTQRGKYRAVISHVRRRNARLEEIESTATC